ncbi:MAG: [Firmicutes bacterium]|nr:[FeFe] hydrogenase H-cluster maturation GTPase HydF [Bacillota bacterium]
MGLNDTPLGERIHIGFFGVRNAGKSSLINAITNQPLSLVSDIAGTTTDPVYKTMEILPLGPVVLIDTPGTDDVGQLGEQRVKKAFEVVDKIHIAILVSDCTKEENTYEKELIKKFQEKNIYYIHAKNKADLLENIPESKEREIYVSAEKNINIQALKEMLGSFKISKEGSLFLGDIVKPLQKAVLVCPIDESAPKGRLILPQQQVIRQLLDIGAYTVVVKDTELESFLKENGADLVITDSQAFAKVNAIVPESIPLTSFSILMARYKGFLKKAVEGCNAISALKDGDNILICEGCTHHRQCKDIGSVKLPALLKKYTKKELNITLLSGHDFPEEKELLNYALVIHCGGCMLGEREVLSRMERAKKTPITNYGIAIAYMNGILKRTISMLEEVRDLV